MCRLRSCKSKPRVKRVVRTSPERANCRQASQNAWNEYHSHLAHGRRRSGFTKPPPVQGEVALCSNDGRVVLINFYFPSPTTLPPLRGPRDHRDAVCQRAREARTVPGTQGRLSLKRFVLTCIAGGLFLLKLQSKCRPTGGIFERRLYDPYYVCLPRQHLP